MPARVSRSTVEPRSLMQNCFHEGVGAWVGPGGTLRGHARRRGMRGGRCCNCRRVWSNQTAPALACHSNQPLKERSLGGVGSLNWSNIPMVAVGAFLNHRSCDRRRGRSGGQRGEVASMGSKAQPPGAIAAGRAHWPQAENSEACRAGSLAAGRWAAAMYAAGATSTCPEL
jgi:hypothetical protein